MRAECVFLSQLADVSADPATPLPTEFVIFNAGENPSAKGSVMFDERAAELVMAEAERWGNEYIVDLEHYSMRPRRVDPDNTDADARGWFRPAMRAGALWATGVTWTPDGESRLRQRRQRYTSPAFYTREEDPTGMPRVTSLINVGLVAQPANNQMAALVASAGSDGWGLDTPTDPEYGRPGMSTPAATTPQTPAAPVETTPAPALTAEEIAAAKVKADENAAADAALAAVKAKADADKAEADAVNARLIAASGVPDLSQALVILHRRLLSASGAADLAGAVALFSTALVEVRAARAAELRSLVTDLIALGAETPATAWSNNAPAARLAAEPLDTLRARVLALRAARPTGTEVRPPTAPQDSDLSDADRKQLESNPALKGPEARARFITKRQAFHRSRA